jgi:hypothetical protein
MSGPGELLGGMSLDLPAAVQAAAAQAGSQWRSHS